MQVNHVVLHCHIVLALKLGLFVKVSLLSVIYELIFQGSHKSGQLLLVLFFELIRWSFMFYIKSVMLPVLFLLKREAYSRLNSLFIKQYLIRGLNVIDVYCIILVLCVENSVIIKHSPSLVIFLKLVC